MEEKAVCVCVCVCGSRGGGAPQPHPAAVTLTFLPPSSQVWHSTAPPPPSPALTSPPSRPMAPLRARLKAPAPAAAPVWATRSTAGSSLPSTARCGTGSPSTWTTTLCVISTPSSGIMSGTWPASSGSTAPGLLTEAPRRRRCRPLPPLLLLLPRRPPPAAQRLRLQPPLCSPLAKTRQKTQPGTKAPSASRLTSARRWTAPSSAP